MAHREQVVSMASPFSSVEAKAKADQSRSEKKWGLASGGPYGD